MERRRVLTVGVGWAAAGVVRPAGAWAAADPPPKARLSADDVALGHRLFTAGAYQDLGRLLPLLLAGADRNAQEGPAGAAQAAKVWVLASQLAVKHGRTEAAGVYAGQAGAMARRSGDPVVLAAAARAAATPLRRTGRTQEALHLLQEARGHLTDGARPTAAELDAAGMAALTAAYTAAQAHLPDTARDFAAQAEQTAHRLARHPHTAGSPWELTPASVPCTGSASTATSATRTPPWPTPAAYSPKPCPPPNAAPAPPPTPPARSSTPKTPQAPSPSCALSNSPRPTRPAAPPSEPSRPGSPNTAPTCPASPSTPAAPAAPRPDSRGPPAHAVVSPRWPANPPNRRARPPTAHPALPDPTPAEGRARTARRNFEIRIAQSPNQHFRTTTDTPSKRIGDTRANLDICATTPF